MNLKTLALVTFVMLWAPIHGISEPASINEHASAMATDYLASHPAIQNGVDESRQIEAMAATPNSIGEQGDAFEGRLLVQWRDAQGESNTTVIAGVETPMSIAIINNGGQWTAAIDGVFDESMEGTIDSYLSVAIQHIQNSQ